MEINRKNTASFDVDAQKGFTPICPDELPVEDGDEIAEKLNRQAEFAKLRVGSKDAHANGSYWEASKQQPQFSPVVGLPNVDIRWNRHCVIGTKGGELLDGLPKETDYDYFVWKGIESYLHPYSAIYHTLDKKLSTGMVEYLFSNEIDTVIVGGLATDYCVKETALDLKKAGFDVIVNLDACRGITSETTTAAVLEMQDKGIVVVKDLTDVISLGD